MTDCLFCRIIAGEIPSEKVAETEGSYAFRDIAPKAPVHVLVVPRAHHADVVELAAADPAALADLVALGKAVADTEAGGQFRLVFNTGTDAGQTVFHAHGHVIAGGELGWNPA